ncbi:hypothetical protein B0H14DRAFT_2610327 [Mycena olivaceomarginata]|nr:hypothetical protein B0H14DRAFT_2610327 [Mycena olivaceomarginata]
MSTGSSPAPRMPRKRQTARITTGGRCPPKISSSQYVDDEAEHDSDGSNGEENVDKYESDFIDDTVQEVEPIEWEDSPPPVVDDAEDSDGDAASNTEERTAADKRAVKKKSVGDSASSATPMVTRSRSRTSTTPNGKHGSDSVAAMGAVLNTSGYKGSKGPSVPGIKSSAVRLGTDPGNTQGVLEVVRKSAGPVKVTMDEAEHAFVGSFTRNKSISSNATRIIFRYIRYERVSRNTRLYMYEKHIAPRPTPFKTDSVSHNASPVKPPRLVSAQGTVGNVPVPTWTTPAAVGFHDAVDDDEMDDAPSVESEQTGDSTATEGTGNRKAEGSASLSKSAMKVANSTPKRKRTEPADSSSLTTLSTPVVHFASPQNGSPAKKRKEEEPELHTIDVKTCSTLPDVCEVMDVAIQDSMMKPIYALQLPRLKKCQVTTWSSSEGPGMFELSYYPVINPKLSIESVLLLSLLSRCLSVLAMQYGLGAPVVCAQTPGYFKHVHPITSKMAPRRGTSFLYYTRIYINRFSRWVMSIDEKPAVCVSIVNCVQSSLLQVSTVGAAASPLIPLLKFITGVHLSQDFERIVGLCGMVFHLDLLHVQLHMSALTFGTKGIPIEQYEKLETKVQPGVKSSGNIYKKNTYVPVNDSLNWNDTVPVYDGRFTGFDASVDIDNIDKILPVYEGDIPANCCTAVGYTISHYVTRTREDHISFNLQWAIVLGEPEE